MDDATVLDNYGSVDSDDDDDEEADDSSSVTDSCDESFESARSVRQI